MDHQASITESDLECMLFDETLEPKPLPFSLLERITNGFSYKMEVGRGGFAVVYKAMLEKGVVAVKRLTHTYMYENEFFREVECLMKVKHRNIVRFLGYCVDTQGNMRMHQGKYVMVDVQQRLLCFEYLPNGGLDHYIKDPSCGLEWIDRFYIIKGICEGLDHLHQLNIVHLDLKPANILLDENMNPKITDFGISRSFQEDQTHITATKVLGTVGYMAPEFISHRISKKYDFYSLGIIMLEIMTGEKRCQGVETVLKSWSDRLHFSHRNQECEQIRVCVEIGIECTDFDPEKRPVNMTHIIERLSKTERIEYYNELHPLKHRFYPRLSESIPCSLQLTNKTDEDVAFRLMEIGNSDDFSHCVYGVVPPRSTYTWIGPTKETGLHLVLQSSITGNTNITLFKSAQECFNFFKQAEELGHAVYEVAINTRRRGDTASELAVRPTIIIKPVFEEHGKILLALDAHPTKPWIVMVFSDGNVTVWDHKSKTTKDSFKISEEQVLSILFHAKKNWIVATTLDDVIHVYDCACITQIQKITSFQARTSYSHNSFGIHPTKPYVVSSSMALWDGDKGWQCTRKFGTGRACQLKFNQEDPNSFAAALYGDYVEVWSLDSPEPNYTLYGHSGMVMCLEFFKHGDRQCLITSSTDCTAKIWDLQKRTCIHTIQGFMSPVTHVISLPGRPYVVTCLKNATIHVWSSTDFRLKKTVIFSNGGDAFDLVCLMGSRRIVIGQAATVTIMDIDDDEEVASEGNNENSECATGQSSNP